MISLKKTAAQIIVASSLIASADAFAKYTEVRRLGTSEALCQGGVKSMSEFQAWTSANGNTIAQALEGTRLQGQHSAIMAAVARGEMVEKFYQPGTTFHWMTAIKKGKATALRDRIWAGEEAIAAYEMQIEHDGSNYTLVIPKICCNFSLASVAEIPKPEPKPVAKAPAPKPEPKPEPVVEKPGVVPFIGLMAGTESLERYEPAWDMYKKDSSGFFGIKAGIKIPVAEGLNLVPALGIINRTGLNEGNEYPETTANIDFGVEKQLNEQFFVGGGLGIWNVNESDYREGSAFLTVGGTLTEKTEWFTEGRYIDADESGSALSAGIRFNF